MSYIKQIRNHLGESPLWHPQKKQFFWVDITQKHIHCLSQDYQIVKTISLPDKVGCIVLADNNNLIAALSREIVEVCLNSHEIRVLYTPDLPKEVIFNDGKVDCMGRLWVGTKDIAEQNPSAALYCFDHNSFTLKQDQIFVSNGIDWNLDNTVMYYTDSPRQEIYQYDYDSQYGSINNQRLFARIDNGYPDGLTVDNQGRVWSAHWDGSCVTCYAPDGRIEKVIHTKIKRPTSCCFGGEQYQTLFVTSASIGLDIDAEDSDGFIFLDDSLAIGKPSYPFRMTDG